MLTPFFDQVLTRYGVGTMSCTSLNHTATATAMIAAAAEEFRVIDPPEDLVITV